MVHHFHLMAGRDKIPYGASAYIERAKTRPQKKDEAALV